MSPFSHADIDFLTTLLCKLPLYQTCTGSDLLEVTAKKKTTPFLLVVNFAEISFSSRAVTTCGLGDSAHRVRRGREPEDVKDLGR
jgi:hypothetical protein